MAGVATPAHHPFASTSGVSAVRTRARARWSSTRWLTSLSSSSSHTSSAGTPDQVAQRDHGPLSGRQARRPLASRCSRSSAASRPVSGSPSSLGGGARPAAVGTERPRLDRRPGLAPERRERDAAGVADRAGACAVHEDLEDPRPQGRAALEILNSADHGRATSPEPPHRPPRPCARTSAPPGGAHLSCRATRAPKAASSPARRRSRRT